MTTTNTNQIKFSTDSNLRITSGRLTDSQIRSARVLGGPSERAGIVEVEIDGETLFGALTGQVVNRRGLQLSPIVHPTYEDALRSKIADRYGWGATAEQIDRDLAEIRATNEAVSS